VAGILSALAWIGFYILWRTGGGDRILQSFLLLLAVILAPVGLYFGIAGLWPWQRRHRPTWLAWTGLVLSALSLVTAVLVVLSFLSNLE
jgi:hypothetical protein